jgi:hypothetical protein
MQTGSGTHVKVKLCSHGRLYVSGYIGHVFSTSAVVGGEWSASRPCRFNPQYHSITGWVRLAAGLDDIEK